MIQQLSRKAGFMLAVAGAAVVGGATTAFVAAAIPSATDGQIHGCYQNNTGKGQLKGALRVIDDAITPSCNTGETSLDWNQNGGGPKGYAYINSVFDPATSQYNSVFDASRSKNIITTNPNNLHCLTLTNGTPANVSVSSAFSTANVPTVAFKDQNGWSDQAGAASASQFCDQNTPSANIYVDYNSYFVTVY